MMNEAEKKQVTQLFAITAAYYRAQLPDEVLKLYAEDLSELTYAEASAAIGAYRRDPKNRAMPLPAQLIAIAKPATDPLAYGREVAGRCVKAIGLYGWPQPHKARAYIGEEGWQVIEEKGGWTHFCGQHGVDIDPGQFAAQTRDRVADQVEKKGIQPRVVELVAPERPQLEEPPAKPAELSKSSASDVMQKLFAEKVRQAEQEKNSPGPA